MFRLHLAPLAAGALAGWAAHRALSALLRAPEGPAAAGEWPVSAPVLYGQVIALHPKIITMTCQFCGDSATLRLSDEKCNVGLRHADEHGPEFYQRHVGPIEQTIDHWHREVL